MGAIDYIISYLTSVQNYFYNAYLEVIGWVWPFYNLAYPLYYLYLAFYYITYYFGVFNTWVADVTTKVANLLTYTNIYTFFKPWFDAAINAWNWVSYATTNILSITNQWFLGIVPTIQAWIATATEGLANLKVAWNNFWTVTFPQWTANLNNLNVAWNNFWTVTFPTLMSKVDLTAWWDTKLKELDEWKDSVFKDYEPFWAGWLDWKDKVIEFFTDPEKWLYEVVDRIIERFW